MLTFEEYADDFSLVWLSAEPDRRGSVVNVRLATLQAMNCRAELTAHRISTSHRRLAKPILILRYRSRLRIRSSDLVMGFLLTAVSNVLNMKTAKRRSNPIIFH